MWKGHADARPDSAAPKLKKSVPAPDGRSSKGSVDWRGKMDSRPSSKAPKLKKK